MSKFQTTLIAAALSSFATSAGAEEIVKDQIFDGKRVDITLLDTGCAIKYKDSQNEVRIRTASEAFTKIAGKGFVAVSLRLGNDIYAVVNGDFVTRNTTLIAGQKQAIVNLAQDAVTTCARERRKGPGRDL